MYKSCVLCLPFPPTPTFRFLSVNASSQFFVILNLDSIRLKRKESTHLFHSNVHQLAQHACQINQLNPLFRFHDQNAHVAPLLCRQQIQLGKVVLHDVSRITHDLLNVHLVGPLQIRVDLVVVEVAVQDAMATHEVLDHGISHRERTLDLLLPKMAICHLVGLLGLCVDALGSRRMVLVQD